MKYAELKARTYFSFLSGASSPEEMIQRASELGLVAIGIADTHGVYGIPKAYHARKSFPGLKLLVGAEVLIDVSTQSKRLQPKHQAIEDVSKERKERAGVFASDMNAWSACSSDQDSCNTRIGKHGSGGVRDGNYRKITIHVQNRKAYGLLCRMLTAAHADQPKGEACLDWEKFKSFLAMPESQGWFLLPEAHFNEEVRQGTATPLDQEFFWQTLRDFLPDNVFVPLGRFRDGKDRERTLRALAIQRRYGIKIVATNDVHSHIRSRHRLQDVLTSIRVGKPLREAGFQLFPNAERYLKSGEQMAKLFRDLPDAISRTVEIADQCSFCPSELRYRYPSEWIPAGFSAQSYLEHLTWQGAAGRYPRGVPESVRAQIQKELGLIAQLQFADYFLTIYEIVEFARSRRILCQGRGSAANSAVCYCLGITAVDPSRMDLLFERFISAERGEPPDIDVDFEHERREEVIQHIYEKYGRDRAAMVSAVVTYRRRSAFREISKALGVEVGNLSAKDLQKCFSEAAAGSEVPDCERLVEELSDEMEGFPRHLSIHSGGFTLSADPIIEIVPVEPARMDGRTIIQWDKYDLDYLGLLKVDVLALGMLSALRKTLDEVGMALHEIPAEDPATYRMIQQADTVGTFQIESRAQMSMLGRLLPRTFYDLVIQVAIVRPGPIIGKMVHPFLKRRRGREKVEYPDPRLEKILSRTLGVPLFQEQVMSMAIDLAGFSPGEADELRRAIGAWRSTGSIEKMGKRLMDGLVRGGLSPEFAQQTFEQIQGFASYGFPESHAASFALIAYASAYLKCHHPAEFLCALINSQPMGFYSNHTLVDDAKRHGVTVLPVDPHCSEWDARLVPEKSGKNKAVRLGFRVVSGMSRAEAEKLIQERERRSFVSLQDFIARTRIKPGVLQRMALGNAFVCFGGDQRQSLWRILEYRLLSEPGAQLSLFSFSERSGGLGESLEVRGKTTACAESEELAAAACAADSGEWAAAAGVQARNVKATAEKQPEVMEPSGETKVKRQVNSAEKNAEFFVPLTQLEAIQEDYSAYGLSTQGHPMIELRRTYRLTDLPISKLKERSKAEGRNGRTVSVAGLVIVRQKPPTAKGVCFATLEDETGFLDLILHSEVYERYQESFLSHCFIQVSGQVQRDTHAISLLVKSLRPILKDEEEVKQASEWTPDASQYFNPMRSRS